MQASNAPTKSPVPFAESGSKNTIPVASQIGITPGLASFTDGFPPLTMTPLAAGGIPPRGQDFNGILFFLSAATRWQQAGAGYSFDSAFAASVGGYPKGAQLKATSGDSYWLSLVDNNSVDPDAGPSANWTGIAILNSPQFTGAPGAPTPPLGTSTTQIATTAFVQVAVALAQPPGSVAYFAMSAAPANWLKANGAAVSVSTYAALATNIYCGDALNASALWGYRCTNPASPSTTRSITGDYIVLPDLRGEFARGWDDGRGVDPGRLFGGAQSDALQNITGSFSLRTLSDQFPITAQGDTGALTVAAATGAPDARTTASLGTQADATVIRFNAGNSPGARTAAETRPRNVALLACIKY